MIKCLRKLGDRVMGSEVRDINRKLFTTQITTGRMLSMHQGQICLDKKGDDSNVENVQ